jgi:hypothetical protein
MGWLNFGGKKRKQAQGFGNSKQGKSRPRRKTFILEKIVTPSAGVGGWLQDFDSLHQLLGSLSLSDLHLPNFLLIAVFARSTLLEHQLTIYRR